MASTLVLAVGGALIGTVLWDIISLPIMLWRLVVVPVLRYMDDKLLLLSRILVEETEKECPGATPIRLAWALFALAVILSLIGSVIFSRGVSILLVTLLIETPIIIALLILERRKTLYHAGYRAVMFRKGHPRQWKWRVTLLFLVGEISFLRLGGAVWIAESVGERVSVVFLEALLRMDAGSEWSFHNTGTLLSMIGFLLYVSSVYVAAHESLAKNHTV